MVAGLTSSGSGGRFWFVRQPGGEGDGPVTLFARSPRAGCTKCRFVSRRLPLGLIAARETGVARILSALSSVCLLAAPRQRTGLPVALVPAQREFEHPPAFTLSRRLHRCPEAERSLNDGALRVWIVRWPGGVPEGHIDEDGPRRVRARRDGSRRGQPDGWDAGSFEVSCDQTDRLVTDRSNRHEEHHVRLLSFHMFE